MGVALREFRHPRLLGCFCVSFDLLVDEMTYVLASISRIFARRMDLSVTLFFIDMANVLEWSESEFSTEIFRRNFPFSSPFISLLFTLFC